jgi:hypothetical protein
MEPQPEVLLIQIFFNKQTGTGGLEVLSLSNFSEKQNWGLFFIKMAVDHPTLIVTLCEVEVGGFNRIGYQGGTTLVTQSWGSCTIQVIIACRWMVQRFT